MNEPTSPLKNRRRSRRVPPKGGTRVVCRKGMIDLGTNLALKLLDVSETGLRLLVCAPLPPNQEVMLGLEGVQYGRPLKCPGAVTWSVATADGQYCVGIRLQKCLSYREFQLLAAQG